MAGITLAWLIGETIIVWRSVSRNHRPPMPGELLGSSVFFALLAMLAEYPPARTTATLMAFGVDIAAWLQAPLVTSPAAATASSPAAVATGGRSQGVKTPATAGG
jgi:hypothetical protein